MCRATTTARLVMFSALLFQLEVLLASYPSFSTHKCKMAVAFSNLPFGERA